MEQRLQKLLASAGIGSRRYCETLITAGRVSVNGVVIKDLGAKADADVDTVEMDGRQISGTPEPTYIVLNKPLGYVSTVSDPHARHTVMDLVSGAAGRIYPVGRLDADSAGLLLLTNDGAFTQILTHPSHQAPKTYRVVARGLMPEWAGADLRRGIILEDGMTAPAVVEWVDYDEANNASIIDITLHEGRNRQVRRMFDAVGFPVLALTRIRIGPIELKGLAPGTWRKLRPDEVAALRAAADSSAPSLPQKPVDDVGLGQRPSALTGTPAAGKTAALNVPRSASKGVHPSKIRPDVPGRKPSGSTSRGMQASESARLEAMKLTALLSSIPDDESDSAAESPPKGSRDNGAPRPKRIKKRS